MNRSFFIVMIPVLLVALGYVPMLRHLGFAPGYPRLFVAMAYAARRKDGREGGKQ